MVTVMAMEVMVMATVMVAIMKTTMILISISRYLVSL